MFALKSDARDVAIVASSLAFLRQLKMNLGSDIYSCSNRSDSGTASLFETVAANQRSLEVELNSYEHELITYIILSSVQPQTVQST
jgi:hypothetical protein